MTSSFPYENDDSDLNITHADGEDTVVDIVNQCDAFGNGTPVEMVIRKPRP